MFVHWETAAAQKTRQYTSININKTKAATKSIKSNDTFYWLISVLYYICWAVSFLWSVEVITWWMLRCIISSRKRRRWTVAILFIASLTVGGRREDVVSGRCVLYILHLSARKSQLQNKKQKKQKEKKDSTLQRVRCILTVNMHVHICVSFLRN